MTAALLVMLALASGGAGAQTDELGQALGGGQAEAPAHAGGDQATPAEAAAADATEAIEEAVRQADAQADETPAEQGAGPADQGQSERPDVGTRLEALIELNRLMDAKQYEEAARIGEQLLKLTRQEFGDDTLETAQAYISLARAERDAGEHDQSEQNYLHGIDLIRSIDGNFSERAIDPLVGLGDNYHQAGQYLNAVTSYNEARTISRRVYGLLNEGQIPILDKITDSFVELDQYQDADQQQLDILRLAERNYPEGSPKYLEGIYRYAGWLRESGRYNEEREQYDRAMRIVRDRDGKESVMLVKPLRESANSFRIQRVADSRGLGALKTALEIVQMQPNPDPLLEAQVLRDMGDWQVAFAQTEPDLEVYVNAWRLLDGVDNGEQLRKQWFGDLENVLREPISQRGLSRDPTAKQGYVVVQFDVDRNGQTRNVAVVKSDPPGFKDDAISRAVSRWRFRPLIMDGAVVPRDQVALRFNYRYTTEDGDQEA